MSDPNTLGRLVRRRRLESGYSLGQLASKVGKTAAEVRAWERDAELPEHGILERLSETLEIDLGEIQARLDTAATAKDAAKVADGGEAEPVKETGPARKSKAKKPKPKEPEAKEPEAKEPEADVSSADEPAAQAPVAKEPEAEEEAAVAVAASVSDAAEEIGEDFDAAPGFVVDDPFTPPGPLDHPDDGGGSEPDFDLLEAPTEPVPVPVITETATAARAERAVAVLEEPAPMPVVESAPDADPGLLRYLEPVRLLFDPDSRYLYWIRAGMTVVAMLIFAVIMLDQLGKLLDAVGELLDTIEPAATSPDDLDALGPIGR